MNDHTNGESQCFVEDPHPCAVTAREVIVDGHDMHTFPCKRVEVHRQCADERFPFSSLHLSNTSFMQCCPADDLHIEGHHVPRKRLLTKACSGSPEKLTRTADKPECFWKKICNGYSFGNAHFEFLGVTVADLLPEAFG